jgi:hypothetical protein
MVIKLGFGKKLGSLGCIRLVHRAWVRGPWIDARNLRAIAMACAGRIRGVYLGRGRDRGCLGDRQELLGDWNSKLF